MGMAREEIGRAADIKLKGGRRPANVTILSDMLKDEVVDAVSLRNFRHNLHGFAGNRHATVP